MESPSHPLLHAGFRYDPAYVQEAAEGRCATSTPLTLATGTGYSIYKSQIIPAIKAAQREVILVTCFWANSATRDLLNEALRELSEKALASSSSIKIRICFSSSSLARNVFLHTPKDGQHYPPASWKKLGLPAPEEIKGLDLQVTRKFFWPLGIIHSKYVLIDQTLAIFPSCNVSWERWFEVAVTFRGPIVQHLLSFHTEFWRRDQSSPAAEHSVPDNAPDCASSQPAATLSISTRIALLPSPHTPTLLPNHLQPRALIGHCPCVPSAAATYSQTPLLKTTFHMLSTAETSIIMLTPNLTEPLVLQLLLQALERGVHVCIWTNRDLMTMEQLVTAGTTTPSCIQTLHIEAEQARTSGLLKTFYFDTDDGPGEQHPVLREIDQYRETVPIKLHAKMTIVDGDKLLVGSGNMDAASWKTSQELGVLIESHQLVEEFKKQWKFSKLEP